MKAQISARARDDLDYIYACICARQGIEAGEQFLEAAKRAVGFLVQHPEAGPHPGWAIRHKSLRFWVISRTNFLIYYFAEDYGVSIERVLDGRRDVKRIIEQGSDEPQETEEE
jgi:plasmid stabilization system protein ParE